MVDEQQMVTLEDLDFYLKDKQIDKQKLELRLEVMKRDIEKINKDIEQLNKTIEDVRKQSTATIQ